MNNTPNKQEEIEKETQEILNNPEIMKEIRKQRERERTGDYSDFIPLKDLFIKEDKEIFALGNAMEDYKKECISLKRQLENTSSALHLKINRLQDHAKEDYDKGFYKGIKEGKAQALADEIKKLSGIYSTTILSDDVDVYIELLKYINELKAKLQEQSK